MVVEKGYKMTEVGVIPEDWEVAKLIDVTTLINGRAFKQYELLKRGRYLILRVGNLFTNTSYYYSDLELSDNFYIERGDLIYAWSASFGPRFWEGGKSIYHYHIWKVVPKDRVSKFYLYHFLNFDKSKQLSQIQGGTMLHLTKVGMESRFVSLPPLPEQTAIAEALSDMDALIAQTEKLIEKKKAIKQGMMQELLKPKEGWVTKRLGDLCELKNGYAFKSNSYNSRGRYNIVTISNVQEGILDTSIFNKIKVLPNDIQPHQILSFGDILVSLTGNVGRVCRVNMNDCLLNQRVGKIITNGMDSDFIFSALYDLDFKKQMIKKSGWRCARKHREE